MVRKHWIFVFMVLVFSLLLMGMTQLEAADYKLKAVCFLPKTHELAVDLPDFVQRVAKETGEKVVIDWIGGPEVIPTFEQVEAVRKGRMVDVAFVPGPWYTSIVPAAGAFSASRLFAWEERKSGFYDLMVEHHKEKGLMYLGRWAYDPFYIWIRSPVQSPKELVGKKFRTGGTQDRFVIALGAIPVKVPHAETYTALERGLVEGITWPLLGPRQDGWTRVVKHVIDHSWWDMQNLVLVMNLQKWNELGPDFQKTIQGAAAKFEEKMVANFKERLKKEREAVEAAGVKFIKFSNADEAASYVELAYSTTWKEVGETLPASAVQKLKDLSSRK